jgi:hypothetical protein
MWGTIADVHLGRSGDGRFLASLYWFHKGPLDIE